MPKLIIFDFDGTLADTQSILYEVVSRLSKKYGIPEPTKDEIAMLRKISIRERLKKFNVPLYKLPSLAKEAMNIYSEYTGSAPLFPEIKEMLTSLKEHDCLIAVVSSNSVSNIKKCFHHHNLNYFEHIYGKASIFGKERLIMKVIKKFKINKEDVFYVGDELRDIEACRKIGLKIISVPWGYDDLELLEKGKPDFLVHNPLEIQKIIIQQ